MIVKDFTTKTEENYIEGTETFSLVHCPICKNEYFYIIDIEGTPGEKCSNCSYQFYKVKFIYIEDKAHPLFDPNISKFNFSRNECVSYA